LTDCPIPLDPLDIEALASGTAPVVRAEAAAHAAACAACGASVRRSVNLDRVLEVAVSAIPVPGDLAERILRIRPFSRGERFGLAVWKAPVLLFAALGASGTALIAGPPAGPREQIGLGAAAIASAAGLARASWRWLIDLSQAAPSGLAALSEGLRATPAGWAALILLPAAVFGLRRVLSRARALASARR
jgi:hypothetical protein